MSIEVDTTTPRLSNFEAGVIAELCRLQCREAELIAHIQQQQAQAEEADSAEPNEQTLELVNLRTEVGRLTVENQNLQAEIDRLKALTEPAVYDRSVPETGPSALDLP